MYNLRNYRIGSVLTAFLASSRVIVLERLLSITGWENKLGLSKLNNRHWTHTDMRNRETS